MDRGFLKKPESYESSFPRSPVPNLAPPWFAGATGRVTGIIPASLAPSAHSPFLRRLSGRCSTSGSKPIFPAPVPDTWRLPDHGLSFLFVFNTLMDADSPGAAFDANPALRTFNAEVRTNHPFRPKSLARAPKFLYTVAGSQSGSGATTVAPPQKTSLEVEHG